jgi:predicted anti-sigma-YlaC factor YlaD
MLTQVPSSDCLAAREAASARVDGELSQLEAARLDAHLLRCADCGAFAAEAALLARKLRLAEPERPRTPIVLPRPRRLALSSWAAAAVLLVAATGSSFALGHVIGGRSPAAPAAFGENEAVRLHQDSARQHVLALLNPLVATRPRFGPVRAV